MIKPMQTSVSETSFTAKIEELTARNAYLEVELEQVKLTASQTDSEKIQLGAELKATQSMIAALREENQHMRQITHQCGLVVKFLRTKALGLDEGIKEVCKILESTEAQVSDASTLSTTAIV